MLGLAKVPRGYWKDPATHRQFFDNLAKHLNITNFEQWYRVSSNTVKREGGRGFLRMYYGDSLIKALTTIYPEHPWDLSKFGRVPKGFWKDEANRRLLFERVAKELNVKQLDDWYRITSDQVRSRGGNTILNKYYNDSLVVALQSLYPDHAWDPSKFAKVSNGFWKDRENQRRFMDKIGREHFGIKQLDDWYAVTAEDVRTHGGGAMMSQYYGNSLYHALQAIYPEHDWDPIRFAKVPSGFWRDLGNQRRFFDRLGREHFGVKHLDDWYAVSAKEVRARGASGLLSGYYQDSLVRALQAIYPEHPWDPTRFASSVPRNYWKDNPENHRRFFDGVAAQLGLDPRIPENWYAVDVEQVHALGGRGLLNEYYGGSLVRALQAVYPEHAHAWEDPSRFLGSGAAAAKKVPRGYWKDNPANHRKFFDRLASAEELDLRHIPDDWYRVSLQEVTSRRGGATLINEYYGGSLVRALQAVYPEHRWEPWRFSRLALPASDYNNNNSSNSSSSSSDSRSNDNDDRLLADYIASVAKEFGIQHLDDWYRVSTTGEQLKRLPGYRFLKRNGGLALVLKRLYPDHHWDDKKFATGKASAGGSARKKKASQRSLRVALQKIFPPDTELLEEYQSPQLVFSASQQPMELDLYLPSLSLAFEYQGEQHYQDIAVFGGSRTSAHQQRQDEEKATACREAGITLISVPYWWDRKVESLAATIRAARPDLAAMMTVVVPSSAELAASSSPIPATPQQQ